MPRLTGLAGSAALALAVLTPAGSAVAADGPGDTLYVAKANCSPTGPGTKAQPFCTVQAAADAVQPGQTVKVGPGNYAEQVSLTRSGTADHPITFDGGGILAPARIGATQQHGLTVTGAAYVTVRGFLVNGTAEAVVLDHTDHVTLDGNRIGAGSLSNMAPATVRLTGGPTATTLSRNHVYGSSYRTVSVEAGATGTVLTGNSVISYASADTVVVTDAPGTVITNNSVQTDCGTALSLAGSSAGATVANNILAGGDRAIVAAVCDQLPTKLAVAATAEAGTRVSYNLLNPYVSAYGGTFGRGTAYRWGGKDFSTVADFTTASGQGAHDLIADPKLSVSPTGMSVQAGSPAIDSGDADAPGVLDADFLGHHVVDDPDVPNTGPGGGYRDRGAQEFTDSPGWPALSSRTVPTDSPVTVTPATDPMWSPAVSYRIDFGDGSTPVTEDKPLPVTHSWPATGTYQVAVTTYRANGDALTVTPSVQVNTPGPLVPHFDPYQRDGLTYTVSAYGTSPWDVTATAVDFGDGSQPASGPYLYVDHTWPSPGDYQVTVTVTDAGGRTEKLVKPFHVDYHRSGYHPVTPTRVMDTRTSGLNRPLGTGESLTIPLDQLPAHVTAVVLNVTAVSEWGGGYLTVYPAGGDRPSTSNLNFRAGATVPNLVTVPVGHQNGVSVYNFAGNTHVVADLLGYYTEGSGDRFTALAPARLLDTRASGRALGAGGEQTLQVTGRGGVPAGATAAVLNVTGTRSTSGGYLTVYPTGQARPGTSNLNFTAGQTVPNQVVVPLGADGKVTLYNRFGSTDVVVDVFGYYSPTGDSLFVPVRPTRLADTRRSGNPLGTGGTLTVPGGTPAGATGAVLNVTSTAATTGGYLTVWAHGTPRPGTSNLNFTADQTVPNHVTTPLGADGSFDVYNFAGSTQVVADLFGFFLK
ncbi:PKD domain-containing protein [Kitasatospora sp. NPDC002227]|uniref:PKD domain-containing protein n=1 Tax=Kitasatospora sp. NPDC002227 TaxID=3154773 RepID=UPI00332CFE48